MRYFIGIDGGGTKTRALLVDERGKIRGRGEAGPGNYHNEGRQGVERNIQKAVLLAWKNARLSTRLADGAFLGMAGVKSGNDQLLIRQMAERLQIAPVGHITVANDLANALAGGLSGKSGIAVIAGTGSNALGRDDRGEFRMCGGWGWLLDDEGGAGGIAFAALRQVVRSHDGEIPKTSLIPAALAFLGIRHPDDISHFLYVKSWKLDFIAQFARVVMDHAKQGDVVAMGVLKGAAKRLASQVSTLIHQMHFKKKKVPVVLLGGCLEKEAFYLKLVKEEIEARAPRASIQQPMYASEEGAVFNALNQAGIPIPSFLKIKK